MSPPVHYGSARAGALRGLSARWRAADSGAATPEPAVVSLPAECVAPPSPTCKQAADQQTPAESATAMSGLARLAFGLSPPPRAKKGATSGGKKESNPAGTTPTAAAEVAAVAGSDVADCTETVGCGIFLPPPRSRHLRGGCSTALPPEASTPAAEEEVACPTALHVPQAAMAAQPMQQQCVEDSTAGGSCSDDPPPHLVCPITGSLIMDPVIACDGRAYEREAIEVRPRISSCSCRHICCTCTSRVECALIITIHCECYFSVIDFCRCGCNWAIL